MKKLKVLLVGCGHMGGSHGMAYENMPGYELVGVVARSAAKAEAFVKSIGASCPVYTDYYAALDASNPDVVCICTYTETHAPYAIKAFEKGCHVFLEKPIAQTVEEAKAVAEAAKKANKKLVVGYILRHHPSWKKFVEVARTLGKPLVMRMNLNQQSHGEAWRIHKNLLASLSPIVDCGVHYIDVMCQMTRAKPVSVSAIYARLSDEIAADKSNYGQLQIRFDDGSVGWYEAGWGPMISTNAFFIKDVIGPKGCASICAEYAHSDTESDTVNSHTKTEKIRLHSSQTNPDGSFAKPDQWLDNSGEPDHNELCRLEQEYLYNAIVNDTDLSDHIADAVNSLAIALAADKSAREGKTVYL